MVVFTINGNAVMTAYIIFTIWFWPDLFGLVDVILGCNFEQKFSDATKFDVLNTP